MIKSGYLPSSRACFRKWPSFGDYLKSARKAVKPLITRETVRSSLFPDEEKSEMPDILDQGSPGFRFCGLGSGCSRRRWTRLKG